MKSPPHTDEHLDAHFVPAKTPAVSRRYRRQNPHTQRPSPPGAVAEVTYLSNLQEHERPFLGAMRELGLHVQSIPWQEPPRRSARFAAAALGNLCSPHPLNVAKDYDRRLRARARQLIEQQRFDLLVCDFVQTARNAIGLPVRSLLFQHNVDGVLHFVRGIWPLVKAQVPEATFTIVGRNPSRSVQELGNQPGVKVTGTVADISVLTSRVRLSASYRSTLAAERG